MESKGAIIVSIQDYSCINSCRIFHEVVSFLSTGRI